MEGMKNSAAAGNFFLETPPMTAAAAAAKEGNSVHVSVNYKREKSAR